MMLRSLMLGDCDFYLSPYIHGVAAASGRLGILHSQVNIRAGLDVILKRVQDVQPHLLWTHMLMWAPQGSPPTPALLQVCRMARQRYGTRVVIHDGDLKEATRHPVDISDAVDLALLNHHHDRSAWQVPTLYWPYACFTQDGLAFARDTLRCGMAFAGQVGVGIYAGRSGFVNALSKHPEVGLRVFDGGEGNTLLWTADVAASAGTVLGYGRPGSGWVDNRVFQYPGAGAILLHDDVPEGTGMEPWTGEMGRGHYVPYESDSVASILDALARLRAASSGDRTALRWRAFQHGQKHHSYTARVKQVLGALKLE